MFLSYFDFLRFLIFQLVWSHYIVNGSGGVVLSFRSGSLLFEVSLCSYVAAYFPISIAALSVFVVNLVLTCTSFADQRLSPLPTLASLAY